MEYGFNVQVAQKPKFFFSGPLQELKMWSTPGIKWGGYSKVQLWKQMSQNIGKWVKT